MPHLIIEYAETLATDAQVPALLDAVHNAALTSNLFPEDHIKTRAVPVKFYRVGSGGGSFIHAQLRIKSGRSDAQKTSLSTAVLAAINGQCWPADVVTVEVVDMDGVSYAKSTAESNV
jgi:5-carboxymethyl-2-hydroxymuconate isomerase